MARLFERHLQSVIAERLAEEPVVVLTGARTVGKSTVLAACGRSHGVDVLDLDDLETRNAVQADPPLFVAPDRPRPVCIDEFQHALRLLDAIKAELNRDLQAGRYLLTGSTRYSTLPGASQSLTGRAHVVTMWPLSQGELQGTREIALDLLVSDPGQLVESASVAIERGDYEQRVLAGGFPLALARPAGPRRSRWFRDFVDMVIQRDVLEIRKVRQRQVMPLVLRRLAAQTGQVLNTATVASALQLDASLVADLIGLLESVFLVHRLGAFGRTLSSRVSRSPKVHLVDSGLAAYLLGITPAKLDRRSPATLTEFGHLVETFAVNELLKQAGWAANAVEFSHFRTHDGHEVDLVVETDDGRVAGVEVKAASTVADGDFRGLRLLQHELGADFVGGVLLDLGHRAYTYDDRLHVVPLGRLWAGAGP